MTQDLLFGAPHERLTAEVWAHWACPPGVQPGWLGLWRRWAESTAGQGLARRVDAALGEGQTLFPPKPWQALTLTDQPQVRVVILGQDPYHGPGQAHGLAFSVPPGVAIPPSLRHIRQECQRTESVSLPHHGDLSAWARRGVLLLNTSWTVAESQPASHAGWGWEALTQSVLEAIWQSPMPVVCMAWGGHAQRQVSELRARGSRDHGPRLWLASNHPSPLSARRQPAPFLGNAHFQVAREWLLAQGVPWTWAFE